MAKGKITDLDEYRRKRDFGRTPEPEARKGPAGGIFVVHKHAASHLHYDFRLEMEGVLKSWAVPKGPSLDPSVKRLAMLVEDHPLDYAGFEGVIPEGQYGAGTVMIWDSGHWTPEGDPVAAFKKGAMKFSLDGKKLKGKWALVRLKRPREEGKESWLLMKEKDGEASGGRDILDEMPLSAATGRGMEEIGARSGFGALLVGLYEGGGLAFRGRVGTVRFTNPRKALFGDHKISKAELAEYYRYIGPRMMPHLSGRPLTLVRCPDGIDRECFFQKHANATVPSARFYISLSSLWGCMTAWTYGGLARQGPARG